MAVRILAAAATASALAIAAPAIAAGQASSTTSTIVTDGHDGEGQHERVIVLTDQLREHGGSEAGADGNRRVRVYGMGAHMPDCTDQPLVDHATPDGHERTRVVLCGHRQLSAADRSTQLEHVMERIQHMDGLSDASKERVAAALREAIDQLRNTH
jgi:hypothetical protein